MMRVLKEKAWRIEEAKYHLDRIVAIFLEARSEVEAVKRKIRKVMISEETGIINR